MIKTSRPANGAALLSEANGSRSRDAIVLAQSAEFYLAGTVLKIDAGKHAIAAAADTAVAVLLNGVDASGGDTPGVAIARDAEVKHDELVFAVDVDTAPEKATKAAQLSAVGIIVR